MGAGITEGVAGTERLRQGLRFRYISIAPQERGKHANRVGKPRPSRIGAPCDRQRLRKIAFVGMEPCSYGAKHTVGASP